MAAPTESVRSARMTFAPSSAKRSAMPAHYTQMILGALVLAAVLIDTVKLQIRQKLA